MKKFKKVIIVIQARVNSSRLPSKVLLKLNGIPSIIRMTNRVQLSKLADEIWIATGTDKINDALGALFKNTSIKVYRGDNSDVLSRYAKIIKDTKADIVVRLTGDCPLIDHMIIDQAIQLLIDRKVDYVSNIIKRTYPDGQDVEVFTAEALLEANLKANEDFSKEHVTTYIHGIHKKNINLGTLKRSHLSIVQILVIYVGL